MNRKGIITHGRHGLRGRSRNTSSGVSDQLFLDSRDDLVAYAAKDLQHFFPRTNRGCGVSKAPVQKFAGSWKDGAQLASSGDPLLQATAGQLQFLLDPRNFPNTARLLVPNTGEFNDWRKYDLPAYREAPRL